MVKRHSQLIIVIMGGLDLTVTIAAWAACYFVRFKTGWFSIKGPVAPTFAQISDVIVICLLLVLLIFGRMRMYIPRRLQGLGGEFVDIVRACATVWAVLLVISYFLHSSPVSRKLLGMFLVVWPGMLMVYRGTARMVLRFFRRRGKNIRNIAIVGTGRLGQKLFHTLRRQRWTGYEILYFVDDQPAGGASQTLGVPVRGPIENIDRIIEANPVDAVFFALPEDRNDKLSSALGKVSGELVDVNVVPDLLSYHFLLHEVKQVGDLPIVNLTHSPQSGWNAAAKRIIDVNFSLVALITLSPLMLLIAAAIKLTSRGSVFFRQRRTSLGGKEFNIIKFRSMIPGAESEADVLGPARNDPRITPVGRVLRKLSLDELPQLLNVLAGQMSLVGPRPERPAYIKRFSREIPRYMLRHHVKAGMTGWAQVHGYRGRTSLEKRIQYDLNYIIHWSLGLDLWILVTTVLRAFYNRQE